MKFITALLLTVASFATSNFAAEKPNVVVIFIDDMGYGDIGPFGSGHPTPNLDRMASEGMKLTDFYVSSAACTPSRSALLTGCYADRIGMGQSVVFPADKRGLNPDEVTIAEILKKAGYATGCFGKWHLGDQPEFMPLAQGFDVYEGIPYSNDMWVKGNPKRKYPPLPWMKQDEAVAHIPDAHSQAQITDAITEATVNFIRENKDRSFFAYVPHSAVHAPFMVTPERLEAAGDDVMRALIGEIDASTGRILDTLKQLGIDENTLVFFTSDNGGAGKTSSGPLRGHKFGPKYEGHMRVATLARWPGKIPAGSVTSEIGATIDLLPTIAKLAGQPVPDDRIIDGHDISDILLGKPGAKSPHELLYYENGGIRQGKWKLVHYRIKGDWFTELYDLEADLGEQNNIADQHPDIVKRLKSALVTHVAEIKANTRPADFVENPKPLLADSKGVPALVEYLKDKPAATEAARSITPLPSSIGTPPASKIFDMEAIRDPDTLEIEVLKDWHRVEGQTATRQKFVTINIGELWPGQDYRVPVRMVVPADQKAKGFHLTGGNTPARLRLDTKPNPLARELLKGGVGLVMTVVQEPGSYGEREMAQAAEKRFAETLNPRYKIQYWAWPATLMRAITTAYAETDHFEKGKVAATGGSKNGASPSMAILHDERMTAVHATVSPIWGSPLRLCQPLAREKHFENGGKQRGFSGGHFGPNFNQAALDAGHTWEKLQKFVNDISDDVFISRNLEALRRREVAMLFHPGTHDMVAYDLAWGGAHHPDIPIYLGANTGHGKKGHPDLERGQANLPAFLLRHFFPDKVDGTLLTPPSVGHAVNDGLLKVTVRFPKDSGEETGQIWWMHDRAPDGSPRYLSEMIPDANSAEMTHDSESGTWTATIKLDPDAARIDFFSNHRKTIRHSENAYSTYLSSPYTRIEW